jgi:hypothetical protein
MTSPDPPPDRQLPASFRPAPGWNWLLVELHGQGDAKANIGPGDLTRTAARAVVGNYLHQKPAYRLQAARWAAGANRVSAGVFTWAVYPHEHGQSDEAGSRWIEEFAATRGGHWTGPVHRAQRPEVV